MRNIRIFSTALLFILLIALPAANASGPTRTAFCTEGLNSKNDCKNRAGRITNYGPVTLRLVLPKQYKKIAIYQGCMVKPGNFFLKDVCIDGSFTWLPGKSIGGGKQQYIVRISPKLDKLGKIIKLDVRYYPKNGRGCVQHMVRMSYCQSTLAFKIVR